MIAEAVNIKVEKNKYSTLNQVDFNNLDFGKYHTDHMYVLDYLKNSWVEPRIVPFQNISLSPATAAFHYGQTVFEGFKGYKPASGQGTIIFRPHKHWERMNISLERLCMPIIPKDLFMEGLHELTKIDQAWVPATEGCSLYYRPFAFATDAFIRVKPSENYFFIIFCSPVGAYFSGELKVKIESHYVRSAEGGIGFSKTGGNYAASLLPAKIAQSSGYQQIMWTDSKEHKYIEETGASNIMFVIDNVLVTPSLSTSILDGVTRDSILTIAKDWGMKIEERKISVQEVLQSIKNKTLQEAFGTGTAAVVSPISAIQYEDMEYAIPKPSADSFGEKVKKYMNDIKYGIIEDPYGWTYRV
ncbi:MAG: branched-chain amino acid aminotransferase [Cytophagales bacterium]|nr:branched-chain amino acid aminotransferase [Cytophagales bacterium]